MAKTKREKARSQAARLLGSMKSERKARAARENGRRGGRPPGSRSASR